MKKINKTLLFVVLTFIISWSLVAIYLLCGGEWNTPQATVIAIIYMFIPTLVVLIIGKGIYKDNIVRKYDISFKINPWFLIAIFIPLAISLLSAGIASLLPDISISTDLSGFYERFEDRLPPEQIKEMKEQVNQIPINFFWIILLQTIGLGATINAIAGFGEELGWRGFMIKELSHLTFFKNALIIGSIWGVWHAPIILQGHNYPDHPVAGVFMMIFWCILLAFLFNYIRIKSRSVIAAAVMHGTLNASAGFSLMYLKGGNDLIIGLTGYTGFLALIIVILLIYLYDRFITKEKIMKSKIDQYL